MPLFKFRLTSGLLLCGLSWTVSPAWAEKADRDKPMLIEADAMRHDENKLLTHFTGQVVAIKGSMVFRGARMEVQQDKQGQQVATVWAAPNERVFFRQKREGVNEFTEGEGETAIFDNRTDVLTLLKRAELRVLRGTEISSQLSGQKIVFNNSTEVMTVDGQVPSADPSEQRVRAVLTPRKATAAANTSAPAAVNITAPPLQSSPRLGESKKP